MWISKKRPGAVLPFQMGKRQRSFPLINGNFDYRGCPKMLHQCSMQESRLEKAQAQWLSMLHKLDRMMKNSVVPIMVNYLLGHIVEIEKAFWEEHKHNLTLTDKGNGCLCWFQGAPIKEDDYDFDLGEPEECWKRFLSVTIWYVRTVPHRNCDLKLTLVRWLGTVLTYHIVTLRNLFQHSSGSPKSKS